MEELKRTSLPSDIHLQWFGEGDNSAAESTPTEGDPGSDAHAGESNEFLDDMPEPLKTSKSLAKFRDKAGLAQSYLELEGKLGRSVEIPGKDAKPEAWERYFSRIGRPKTAEDYKLTPFVGYKQDPVFDAAFRAAAHRKGMSSEAAAELYSTVTQRLVEDQNAREATTIRAREAALVALKQSLGAEYDAKLAQAKANYAGIFSPESQAILHELGIEDDPRIAADLARLGALFGADKLVDGKPAKAKTSEEDPYGYMRE
jgi:hypothetical protein